MKAIRLHIRGMAGDLVYEDAPLPVLRPGDALVQVLASGLTRNELDWEPTYTDENGMDRLPTIPGHELCGIVVNVASDVTDLGAGTNVYGLTSFFRDGTAAEYVAVRAADLAPKPAALTPIQASAVPLSGLTAWQALFDHGKVRAGQRVLIHGASGGVGTFAIQLARWCGAHVTGVTTAENLSLLSDLGAHQTIDYESGPFESHVQEMDLILDTIGGDIQARSWPLLRPGGTLVSIAGESIKTPPEFPDRNSVFFIVKADRHQLMQIGNLIDKGTIQPIIADVLPLTQARQAFERLLHPAKHGKVVLQIV